MLKQDLRFALRTLARSPIFTTVAVLSLALGIGVNTALFSFVDRLLLRALPVTDPALLTLLDSPGPRSGRVEGDQTFSYPAYRHIRDRNTVFSGVLARTGANVSLTWKNSTELAQGELVSGNYFEVLGVQPYLGRLFTQDDDRTPGAHRVAVLSYGYWRRKFGEDPSVVGKKILVNGQPFDVIGVAPPRFEGVIIGTQSEVFVPMMMKAQITPTIAGLEDRRYWFLNLFARLKPGMNAQQAQAQVQTMYQQVLEADLAAIPGGSARFRSEFLQKKLLIQPGYKGRSASAEYEEPLIVLMCMVGLVLLIACANLANLLIARAAARQKEIAIRLSLGASRLNLIRQLFTESLVIALSGGFLGVIVSVWVGDLLASFSTPPGTPGAPDWSMPDGRILAFNFGLSVLTAILFGLIPAWKATRPVVAGTLKDQAGSVATTIGDVRLRKGLVVAQIGLSLLLLFGATLFARSLGNLRALSPGFRTGNVMAFSIDPALSGYEKEKGTVVLERIRAGLVSVPGVRSVAMTDNAVLSGNVNMATVNIEGYQRKEGESMNPEIALISPEFFDSMGVRMLDGREFTAADNITAPKVVIINSAFAKKWFPNQNPIGHRLGIGGRGKTDHTIIGVAANFKHRDLKRTDDPMYFFPYLQNDNPGAYTYYVRGNGDSAALGAAIRREVSKAASTVPVYDMRTMDAQVDQILAIERAVATMSGFFGLLAAVLAAIGLYGVMAYTVTRRTREIGIRMALGAERRAVLWLVLKEVVIMAAIGISAGVPAAIFLSRYVQSQLYGLKANDPLTMVLAVAFMLGVALTAGFMPANRAARVDPIRALRYE